MADPTKSNVEKVGFWLTVICAVHCIATPLVITFLPILGSKFEMFHRYENAFLFISFILALYLLGRDYREHKNIFPMVLLLTAAVLNTFAFLFLNKSHEVYVSVGMSLLIISAYWLNWKHKARCKCHTNSGA